WWRGNERRGRHYRYLRRRPPGAPGGAGGDRAAGRRAWTPERPDNVRPAPARGREPTGGAQAPDAAGGEAGHLDRARVGPRGDVAVHAGARGARADDRDPDHQPRAARSPQAAAPRRRVRGLGRRRGTRNGKWETLWWDDEPGAAADLRRHGAGPRDPSVRLRRGVVRRAGEGG